MNIALQEGLFAYYVNTSKSWQPDACCLSCHRSRDFRPVLNVDRSITPPNSPRSLFTVCLGINYTRRNPKTCLGWAGWRQCFCSPIFTSDAVPTEQRISLTRIKILLYSMKKYPTKAFCIQTLYTNVLRGIWTQVLKGQFRPVDSTNRKSGYILLC